MGRRGSSIDGHWLGRAWARRCGDVLAGTVLRVGQLEVLELFSVAHSSMGSLRLAAAGWRVKRWSCMPVKSGGGRMEAEAVLGLDRLRC